MNDDYFSWLCGLTGRPKNRNPNRSYWKLLHQLHQKPFRWFVNNDGNRNEDGKELRQEFLERTGLEGEDIFLDMDASMLEMLLALSRRVAYESYGQPADWFWKMLENLDMRHYTDANYDENVAHEVDDAIEVVLDRDYGFEGRGGLFPLRMATTDQRRTELRYQMAAYIIEGWTVDNGP